MPCNTHRKSTHFPVPLNVALDAQVKRASNCYSCEIKFPARTGLSERERGEGGLLKINTFPFLFNFSRNLSTWQRTLTKLDYRWKMCVRVCDGRGENPFFFCEPHSARVFPLENPHSQSRHPWRSKEKLTSLFHTTSCLPIDLHPRFTVCRAVEHNGSNLVHLATPGPPRKQLVATTSTVQLRSSPVLPSHQLPSFTPHHRVSSSWPVDIQGRRGVLGRFFSGTTNLPTPTTLPNRLSSSAPHISLLYGTRS